MLRKTGSSRLQSREFQEASADAEASDEVERDKTMTHDWALIIVLTIVIVVGRCGTRAVQAPGVERGPNQGSRVTL